MTDTNRIKSIEDIMHDIIWAVRKANTEASVWTEEIAELNRTICRLKAQENPTRDQLEKYKEGNAHLLKRLLEEQDSLSRVKEAQIQTEIENIKIKEQLLEERKEHEYYKNLAEIRRARIVDLEKEKEGQTEIIHSQIKELNSKETIISEKEDLIKDLRILLSRRNCQEEKSAAPFTNAKLIGYTNIYKHDDGDNSAYTIYDTEDKAKRFVAESHNINRAVPVYTIP